MSASRNRWETWDWIILCCKAFCLSLNLVGRSGGFGMSPVHKKRCFANSRTEWAETEGQYHSATGYMTDEAQGNYVTRPDNIETCPSGGFAP